jgi:hypothetical protein
MSSRSSAQRSPGADYSNSGQGESGRAMDRKPCHPLRAGLRGIRPNSGKIRTPRKPISALRFAKPHRTRWEQSNPHRIGFQPDWQVNGRPCPKYPAFCPATIAPACPILPNPPARGAPPHATDAPTNATTTPTSPTNHPRIDMAITPRLKNPFDTSRHVRVSDLRDCRPQPSVATSSAPIGTADVPSEVNQDNQTQCSEFGKSQSALEIRNRVETSFEP